MAVDQQAAPKAPGCFADQAGQRRVVGFPKVPHAPGRLLEGKAAAINGLPARDHPGNGAEPRADAGRGAVDEVRQRSVEHSGIQLPGLAVGVAVDARKGGGQQGHAEGRGAREKLLHEPVLRAAERHRVQPAVREKGGRVMAARMRRGKNQRRGLPRRLVQQERWRGFGLGGSLHREVHLAPNHHSRAQLSRALAPAPCARGVACTIWCGRTPPRRALAGLSSAKGRAKGPPPARLAGSRTDGRIAQRESTSLTRRGSQVQSLLRPPSALATPGSR